MKTRLRDGSGVRHYKHTHEDPDRHGNVRVYYQVGRGPKTRIRATPGSPEFEAIYNALFRGQEPPALATVAKAGDPIPGKRPRADSLRWLCDQYERSSHFKRLDQKTQTQRRRDLKNICAERTSDGTLVGTLPYAEMGTPEIAKLRDRKFDTPHQATSWVKALRGLFAYACHKEVRLLTNDPAKDVAYLSPATPSIGHEPWTEDDAQDYEKAYRLGGMARFLFDAFLYTGARVSDVERFGPGMIEQRWNAAERRAVNFLVYTEYKGRGRKTKLHELPILPPLQASLDAYMAEHPNIAGGDLFFLIEQSGKPFRGHDGLSRWFRKQCDAAGIRPGLTPHGIRKLAVHRAILAGAQEADLLALFGWTDIRSALPYLRKLRTKQLEADRAHLLLPAQQAGFTQSADQEHDGNKILPLSTHRKRGGSK
jgi:integrase